MKKTIMVIAIMTLISIGMVHADFREVTCGSGMIGGMCHETELQDEFDDVADMIDDIEDEQLATENEVDNLWDELDDIQNEVDKQRWMDRMHDFRIFLNNIKIAKLEDRMEYQEFKPDKVGGGISTAELGTLLFNDKWFFVHTVSFMQKLRQIFVTHEELEMVRAECKYPEADKWDLENYAALYKADRTGRTVYLEGRMCRPGADRCILI